MKGFLPMTLVLFGIIFNVVIITIIILVSLSFKYHIHINLKFEYDKSYSDLIMLSLMRLNYMESGTATPIYRILSQRSINGMTKGVENFISEKIKLLGDTECFRLANTTHTVLQTNCAPSGYAGKIFIFKPYSPGNLLEEFTLTYDRVKHS